MSKKTEEENDSQNQALQEFHEDVRELIQIGDQTKHHHHFIIFYLTVAPNGKEEKVLPSFGFLRNDYRNLVDTEAYLVLHQNSSLRKLKGCPR